MRYLLDTNICIYIANKRPEGVRVRMSSIPTHQLAMSVVTYGELFYGVQKSTRKAESMANLLALKELIQICPLPERSGEAYSRMRKILQDAGKPIGANDLWIASHAMAEGWTLVTNNQNEFERIEGLQVENWS